MTLPRSIEGIHHDHSGIHDESKTCPDDLAELTNRRSPQLCVPRPSMMKPGRHEPRQGIMFATAANLASNEHMPSNVFLHHVRYEIGEHPLADIVTLTGGGSPGMPVLMGMLVPGGKAEQAGVVTGDELVAVSGRPDFQRTPAERLLESLPTPTLLVFAKQARGSKQPTESDTPVITNGAAWKKAMPPQHVETAFSTSFNVSSYDGERREASDRHTPTWLSAAMQTRGTRPAPADGAEGEGGFAGASWEPGVNNEQTAFSAEDMASRQTISSKRSIDITRRSSEPPPQVDKEVEKPKPPTGQLAIIRRDTMAAGLPNSHSLFGPNVQVEVCDQVVFNPKATLWMQGSQPSAPFRPPAPTSVTGSTNAAVAWEHDRWLEGLAAEKTTSSWMYELPRKEARQLVEIAVREASRADRSSSRQDTCSSVGAMSDLEAATSVFSESGPTLSSDRLASRGVSLATPEPTLIKFDVDSSCSSGPLSGRDWSALNTDAGPGTSATMSSTAPLAPRMLSEAGLAENGKSHAPNEEPCSGPRLGPSGARANAPSRVDPLDPSDEMVSPEDDMGGPHRELTIEFDIDGQGLSKHGEVVV